MLLNGLSHLLDLLQAVVHAPHLGAPPSCRPGGTRVLPEKFKLPGRSYLYTPQVGRRFWTSPSRPPPPAGGVKTGGFLGGASAPTLVPADHLVVAEAAPADRKCIPASPQAALLSGENLPDIHKTHVDGFSNRCRLELRIGVGYGVPCPVDAAEHRRTGSEKREDCLSDRRERVPQRRFRAEKRRAPGASAEGKSSGALSFGSFSLGKQRQGFSLDRPQADPKGERAARVKGTRVRAVTRFPNGRRAAATRPC